MKTIDELIKEAVYTSPLALLSLDNRDHIRQANEYLPYSSAMEIECNMSPMFELSNFENIPYIMDVQIDSGEQRFRIPNGICGLICLYNISEQLKLNSELNEGSGIHYHIDMTNSARFVNAAFIKRFEKKILTELETWEYKGDYNSREVRHGSKHGWVNIATYHNTCEFRIGEMTFDYEILVKRIIHANQIIRDLNKHLIGDDDKREYIDVDPNILLQQDYKYVATKRQSKWLKELEELNKETEELADTVITSQDKMKRTINNRVVKL